MKQDSIYDKLKQPSMKMESGLDESPVTGTIDLGYKYDNEPPCGASVGKKEIQYPQLSIEIMKNMKGLLKKFEVDDEGEATIKFRVKKTESGRDYGPKDSKGCLTLEVQTIKF